MGLKAAKNISIRRSRSSGRLKRPRRVSNLLRRKSRIPEPRFWEFVHVSWKQSKSRIKFLPKDLMLIKAIRCAAITALL
jgi:hypothetical protein